MTTPQHNYRITEALLKPINPVSIIFVGAYTVVWGIWVAIPLWDVFSRAPLYSKMVGTFPTDAYYNELIWGIIAILSGIVMCYGAFRPSYNAIIVGSATASIYWFIISIFYFWGDWHSTGGLTSFFWCILSAFMYTNIRVNHKNGRMNIDELLR